MTYTYDALLLWGVINCPASTALVNSIPFAGWTAFTSGCRQLDCYTALLNVDVVGAVYARWFQGSSVAIVRTELRLTMNKYGPCQTPTRRQEWKTPGTICFLGIKSDCYVYVWWTKATNSWTVNYWFILTLRGGCSRHFEIVWPRWRNWVDDCNI